MQVMEAEEDESEWTEDPQADSEDPFAPLHLRWPWAHLKAGRVGVVPVHLNPHPRRTHHSQAKSLPIQLRYSTPTFDKSNVLVLYVLLFLSEQSEYDIDSHRGPTGSGKDLYLARIHIQTPML